MNCSNNTVMRKMKIDEDSRSLKQLNHSLYGFLSRPRSEYALVDKIIGPTYSIRLNSIITKDSIVTLLVDFDLLLVLNNLKSQ